MKNLYVYNKLLSSLVLLSFAFLLIACGVSPSVVSPQEFWALKNASVISGIESAIQSGNIVLSNPENTRYLFVYNVQKGFGFAGIDLSSGRFVFQDDLMRVVNGAKHLGLYKSANFLAYLEEQGWTVVDKADIPLTIKVIIETAKVSMVSAPTILIIPVGTISEYFDEGFESLIPEDLKQVEMNT